MTPQEKDKLYAAIGYSETAVDPTLPKTVGVIWVSKHWTFKSSHVL